MDEPLITRNKMAPPGSTETTSGSASVRSFARNASYFTSCRSGGAALPPGAIAPIALATGLVAAGGMLIPAIVPGALAAGLDGAAAGMFIPAMALGFAAT